MLVTHAMIGMFLVSTQKERNITDLGLNYASLQLKIRYYSAWNSTSLRIYYAYKCKHR